MIIERYLNDDAFARMKSDFEFLLKMFPDFHGELDIAFRGTYFNIYYRGNSLAKVEFLRNGQYRVGMNRAFYNQSKASSDQRFTALVRASEPSRTSLTLPKNLLHPFFQTKYLKDFRSLIKARGYGEEIMLEQTIITDNRDRDDLVIIDRQIQDTQWKERIDLLALEHIEGNNYHFRILEVKLGRNDDLTEKVAKQLQRYVAHITEHFDAYKACYEKVYQQRKELGLHSKPAHQTINITNQVEGSVVVVGYSGLAREALVNLRRIYPDIHVCQFNYSLDLTKCV